MSKKSNKITESDARRIQSHADKTETNPGFKARVQSVVAKDQKKK